MWAYLKIVIILFDTGCCVFSIDLADFLLSTALSYSKFTFDDIPQYCDFLVMVKSSNPFSSERVARTSSLTNFVCFLASHGPPRLNITYLHFASKEACWRYKDRGLREAALGRGLRTTLSNIIIEIYGYAVQESGARRNLENGLDFLGIRIGSM